MLYDPSYAIKLINKYKMTSPKTQCLVTINQLMIIFSLVLSKTFIFQSYKTGFIKLNQHIWHFCLVDDLN